MDRRQRKTREAIFEAFIELLSQKKFEQITVSEIIELADIGRATFYSHFETKDFLLKELCEELFCHISDTMDRSEKGHRHIFNCNAPDSVFLHLLQHLQRNDNNILELLRGRNNELFLGYFKANLTQLIESQLPLFSEKKPVNIPDEFWKNHIISVFAETIRWWIDGGMKESTETIAEYFFSVV